MIEIQIVKEMMSESFPATDDIIAALRQAEVLPIPSSGSPQASKFIRRMRAA